MVNWIAERYDEKIIFLGIFLHRLVHHRSDIISFTEMQKFLANKKMHGFLASNCCQDNSLYYLFIYLLFIFILSSVPTFVEVGRAQKWSSSNQSHPRIVSDISETS